MLVEPAMFGGIANSSGRLCIIRDSNEKKREEEEKGRGHDRYFSFFRSFLGLSSLGTSSSSSSYGYVEQGGRASEIEFNPSRGG